MTFLVSGKVFGGGTDSRMIMEMQRLAIESGERVAMRRAFREASDGDFDQEVIALGDCRPQAGVEHPVGVGGQGEAVAGGVVAGVGVLVDVEKTQDFKTQDARVESLGGASRGASAEFIF